MGVGKAIKWILLLPLILAGLGIAYCEANKAYWDHRVRELCKKDGGVTVFEQLEIAKVDYPTLKYSSFGAVIFPSERNAKPSDPFITEFNSKSLHEGFPDVIRFEQSIIRSADRKKLSKLISYSRRCGDFPTGISHPSSFTCWDEESEINKFTSVVVLKGV